MKNDTKEKKETQVVVDEAFVSVSPETVMPAEIKNGQLILTDKHKQLIKEQIAPDATKEELELFFMMAYRTRLDPLLKQLYFIKYKGKDGRPDKVSYVTSIDGYRIIAHRTGLFDGVDEPEYKHNNGQLYSCTVRVYRKGSSHAFAATVKFTEYDTKFNNWRTMPETMIAKVAEAHALRKAFPQDLSGIYTTDEMDQANVQNAKQEQQKRAIVNAVKVVRDLLQKKGKHEEPILEAYKVKSLEDMTMQQINHAMQKVMVLPDPDPKNEVDPDQAEKGIEKMNQEKSGS